MGTNPAGGLRPESAGNFIFSMRQYTKQPMPIHDFANLLIARNLVADYDKLLHALRTVGYFRLTGYLYPFRLPNSDDYQHGTTLEKLWTIYTFDRKLRLVTLDALARIEIAVRALIVNGHTSQFPTDPLAYLNSASLPGLKPQRHLDLLNAIAKATRNAKDEPDIRHLAIEYGIVNHPPVWNVMEHSPFGIVTLFYEGLDSKVKQQVSNAFYIQPNAFSGVLMTLKNARNICAHHSRLWNCHIRSRVSQTLGAWTELQPLRESLSRQTTMNYTTVFSLLSICAFCIKCVHPQSQWKERCKSLLKEADPFILKGMGVPSDWQKLSLWQ